ncbi:MAG: SUMF1/EgtB/PvdO family nonheme iron enzyme [Opitutaceae bacterium]|nr:SUMF1/EgtB/PvdO family nonheme iron enzyme [Opitutaceae bacterium]
MNTQKKTGIAALLATLAMTAATTFGAISIETVTVGYAGNAANGSYGAVGYEYQIGKTEVTNAQYVAFLNAVAATDTYGLYNTTDSVYYGIERGGSSGSYSYTVKLGYESKPVNYVSFYDAARFVNWLTNGQGGAGTTETGLYTFTGTETLTATPDHATSTGWVIASEDEWYKAAYYDPTKGETGGYWAYPTKSDDISKGVANYDNNSGNASDLKEAGSYLSASSYFGTYDQGGNLWEWNDAISSGTSRVMRGGSFASPDGSLSAASGRNSNGPAYEHANIGFRVASLTAVPEPSTWAVATGLALLAWAVLRRSRGARG